MSLRSPHSAAPASQSPLLVALLTHQPPARVLEILDQVAFATHLSELPRGTKQLLNRCLPNLILFTFIWESDYFIHQFNCEVLNCNGKKLS